jgi:hypothetical protein
MKRQDVAVQKSGWHQLCKMVMTVIGFRPVRPILNTASWQRSSGLVRLHTMAAPVTAVINILDPAIIASPVSRTVACVLPKQGGAQRPKRGSICPRPTMVTTGTVASHPPGVTSWVGVFATPWTGITRSSSLQRTHASNLDPLLHSALALIHSHCRLL